MANASSGDRGNFWRPALAAGSADGPVRDVDVDMDVHPESSSEAMPGSDKTNVAQAGAAKGGVVPGATGA
ncbi:hypothetical protein [Streptomyces sp. NPDC051546]|uniref:hypothetical protein n=1 Tax=Streptomyces sp. NPDC051546 TaxID=3365655 RepID=UPI003797D41D